MLEQDYWKFSKLYSAAWGQTSGKTPSEEIVSLAFATLSMFTFDEVRHAIIKHLKTDEHFPNPAKIHKLLLGDSEGAATKAWMIARRIGSSIGGAFDIVINDPIAMHTIKSMGGLGRLASHETEDSLEFYGNEFRKAYKEFRLNPPKIFPEILRGSHNQNAKHYNSLEYKPIKLGFDDDVDNRKMLPNFDKPKYEEIEHSKADNIKPEETLNDIKKLLGLVQINQKKDE